MKAKNLCNHKWPVVYVDDEENLQKTVIASKKTKQILVAHIGFSLHYSVEKKVTIFLRLAGILPSKISSHATAYDS